ncbi:hypothetical protein [Pseudarthrobacter raffinosi]|uniref:hypothetical protein n=1 Tax=Pseudarthrobacter raffinosi TaxID=2953651 RepID=UPI0035ABC974
MGPGSGHLECTHGFALAEDVSHVRNALSPRLGITVTGPAYRFEVQCELLGVCTDIARQPR